MRYVYWLVTGSLIGVVMIGSSASGAPAAPTNLTAWAEAAQIVLDWDDNGEPDLAGYHVYRGTNAGGPYSRISGNTSESLTAVSVTADTGEKPQSKVWRYDNTWWSVLPRSDGTWVWRLDGTAWTPVLKLASTTSAKADCKPVGAITHVLLFQGTSSQLASIEYIPGSPGTYQVWSGRPALANITLGSGVEIATIDVDSAGRMWIASDASTTVEVRYSDSPYDRWNGPVTIASGISTDDISVVTALPDGSIGVLWSNQITDRFGFRVHTDGADPASWSADEVPASQSALNVGGGMADDHLNVAVGTDGTIYAAVKTSYDTTGYPKIAFLVRRPTGVWDDLYEVDQSGTRPIVVLNEAIDLVRVVYTQSEGNNPIVFRDSPLTTIAFGNRQTLMSSALNNASSTKQNFTDALVVIASDSSLAASRHMTFDLNTDAVLSEYIDANNPDLIAGQTYYYVVTAENSGGEEGPASNEAPATALPRPASDLAATAISHSQVDLAWTDNAPDEDGFSVERTVNEAVWDEIAVLGPDVTSYSDVSVIASSAYTYRVCAFSTPGAYSLYSNTASATTEAENRPPVADDQDLTTTRDTPLAVTLTASDPDGDLVTYGIVDYPANGTLSGTPPDVTYTPDPGFVGSDSFTFRANDGELDSNLATVSITVTEPPAQHALATQVTVSLGSLTGPIENTHADDGQVQTLRETATGSKGRAGLAAEYVLVTAADPSAITNLTLQFTGSWSSLDANDPLLAEVFDPTVIGWYDLGWNVGSGTAVYETDLPPAYVNSAGELRVRFADSGSIAQEKKDALLVDLLIGLISTGPDLPPEPPSNLQATPGDTLNELTWEAGADPDVIGYNVYRDGVLIASLGTATAYVDTNLINGTAYTYTVTAVDLGNESDPSVPASATPLASLPPRPPTDLNAAAGTGQVTLTWAGNLETNVQTYQIYRSTTSPVVAGAGTLLDTIDHQGSVQHQYIDIDVDVAAPTTFYYVVTAVDSEADESASSAEASATVTPPSQELLAIVSAEYATNPQKLTVTATSTVGGTVTLTLYGGPDENSIDWDTPLDTMTYESGDRHTSRFRTATPPAWVGVTSTGGGTPVTSLVTVK